MHTLLIVESPAKCKKIEEYLGSGYKCVATYGHLRELSSLEQIDIEHDFLPTYSIIQKPAIKVKQMAVLKKAIQQAKEVMLATDADREGEKIAYCVMQLFGLPETTPRIVFHEITETAIKQAIAHPRLLDMNRVHSQQARQILDLLVGFTISPLLWKFIARQKLSAGRCQTPLLQLIYDNEVERKKSHDKKIHKITGYFTQYCCPFTLNVAFDTLEEVRTFMEGSMLHEHRYECSAAKCVTKSPPLPFTTSRIQQVASNEMHISPKETMTLCQSLYEGGWITYMRTDSTTYSEEFWREVSEYVCGRYGDTYMQSSAVTKKTKNSKKEKIKENLTQEAHEAIRPTHISVSVLPEGTKKEQKMYHLIWKNAIQSCMSSAKYSSITASISGFQGTSFTYTCEQLQFAGWKQLELPTTSEDVHPYHHLQSIVPNSIIPYKKIVSRISATHAVPHYTEARLVQLLEEKGIGRPSTFASLLDKIQSRGYATKQNIPGETQLCEEYELETTLVKVVTERTFGEEKSKLVLQPLGQVVIEFLQKYFQPLFQYDYTCEMEEELDKIAKGDRVWHATCARCYAQMMRQMDILREQGEKYSVSLDEHRTYRMGKYGPVIHDTQTGKFQSGEKLDEEEVKKVGLLCCPNAKANKDARQLGEYQGEAVWIKRGKFGLYMTWGDHTKNLKELGNRPIENVLWEDVYDWLEEGGDIVRTLNRCAAIRRGKRGDYIYWKTTTMKKPRFFGMETFTQEVGSEVNYKTCDVMMIYIWVQSKYGVNIMG